MGFVVEAVDGGDSAGALDDLDVGDGLPGFVEEGDRRVAVDDVWCCAVVGEFEGLDAEAHGRVGRSDGDHQIG